MALFTECRAGQTETATWHRMITTNEGEESRSTQQPVDFWCSSVGASKTGKTFRDGLEGKQYSAVIVSTNVSKLMGIEEGAQVDYRGARRNVVAVDFDPLRKLWTIALT
jgi:hypothetical protein